MTKVCAMDECRQGRTHCPTPATCYTDDDGEWLPGTSLFTSLVVAIISVVCMFWASAWLFSELKM